MQNKFYITTTLPYVNADPHIGFALEIVQADAIARFRRMLGDQVFFNTGTDEHGLKIHRKAEEQGVDTQQYVDEYAAKFDRLKEKFDLSYNAFIRTTDRHHVMAAQEFWKRCDANGDIYKKNYTAKYCVGCELEKTDSELVDDKCPLHPTLEIELIEEENYFFRFSKYQDALLAYYEKHDNFVVPARRLVEIRRFVEQGLQDFSVSRLKKKMPWGVPVPGDDDHVMFVWFDALINYISTLGWPSDAETFSAYWPGLQVAGKDNLRQQSAIWQAMLMSAGLPPTRQIYIHGFITAGGEKMSKSTGNAVDPFTMVDRYGTDVLRYYLLRYIHPFEDSDFSEEQLRQAYESDLANGLGNLVSRISGLLEQNNVGVVFEAAPFDEIFSALIDEFKFDQALKYLWEKLAEIDNLISEKKPWELAKAGKTDEVETVLKDASRKLLHQVQMLTPFMPQTAKKIQDIFTVEKIEKATPLFPRFE